MLVLNMFFACGVLGFRRNKIPSDLFSHALGDDHLVSYVQTLMHMPLKSNVSRLILISGTSLLFNNYEPHDKNCLPRSYRIVYLTHLCRIFILMLSIRIHFAFYCRLLVTFYSGLRAPKPACCYAGCVC